MHLSQSAASQDATAARWAGKILATHESKGNYVHIHVQSMIVLDESECDQ